MTIRRQLPSNLDAEKALLSSMVQSDRALTGAVEMIDQEAFHDPANRAVFAQILALWASRKPITIHALTDAVESAGELEQIGGAAYLTEVFFFVPTGANWKYYAETVREKLLARTSIALAEDIIQTAYDPELQKDLPDKVQGALIKMAGLNQTGAETKTLKDVVVRRADYYENLIKTKGKIEGISTGIRPLDVMIRGLRPGNMVTIAAKTKGGKTALATNLGLNVADEGHSVGIFSLEMNEGELADRLIAAKGQVDLGRAIDSGFSKSDNIRFMGAINALCGLNIYIRDESIMTPLQFRAAARMLVMEKKCKLLIVDYLQLMEPTSSKDSRERQVAESSRTVKTTAADLNVPIIVLSQLNDDGRSRESRALENDSNLFIVIEEDFEEAKKNEEPKSKGHFLNVKLARDCRTGRIPVEFRKQYASFHERIEP